MKKNKKVNRLYPDMICIVLGFFLGLLVGVAGNMIANHSSEEPYTPIRGHLVKVAKGFDKGCVGKVLDYLDTLGGPRYIIKCKQGNTGYAYSNQLEQLVPPRKHEVLCISGKELNE